MARETLYILLAFVVGCAVGPWLEAVPPAVRDVWNGKRRFTR